MTLGIVAKRIGMLLLVVWLASTVIFFVPRLAPRNPIEDKLLAQTEQRLVVTFERYMDDLVALRSGVDALQLYISIAALSYFYLGNSHTLSAVFGRNLAAPGARQERLAHMTDVILGYLRPAMEPHALPRRPAAARIDAPPERTDN